MKIILGKKMFKPEEVAVDIGYHPRTIRRFICEGRIAAVNSNLGGKQPVWWITGSELQRLKKTLAGITKQGRPTRAK